MQIIVKSYEHFNRALPNWDTPNGVYVKNKDHYDRLCKEAGMVSYDKAKEEASQTPSRKEYVLSTKAKAIINSASQIKDKKGNVKLGDKAIAEMIKIGAIKKKSDWSSHLPSGYTKSGGFLKSNNQDQT